MDATIMPTSIVPQGGGPPSRGSSADAEECTPPPHPPPFIQPPDSKLFNPANTYNFTMEALSHPSLTGKDLLLVFFCFSGYIMEL